MELRSANFSARIAGRVCVRRSARSLHATGLSGRGDPLVITQGPSRTRLRSTRLVGSNATSESGIQRVLGRQIFCEEYTRDNHSPSARHGLWVIMSVESALRRQWFGEQSLSARATKTTVNQRSCSYKYERG